MGVTYDSDMGEDALELLRRVFGAAHAQAPGGISIEVGTRRGGSALLFLTALEELYPDPRPLFLTVDPYGNKPYLAGSYAIEGTYGAAEYLAAKSALDAFPNHAHFLLEDHDFWSRMPGVRLWSAGRPMLLGQGEGRISFVLLDGDHDAVSVLFGIKGAIPLMHPRGVIVVDNIDKATGVDGLLPPHQRWRGREAELAILTPDRQGLAL